MLDCVYIVFIIIIIKLPHAEQGLRTPRSASPHAEVRLRTPRSASPHAENVCLRAWVHFRTRRTFTRVRSWLSACEERLPACGAGSPHAKNVCPHAELALRTRRTYVRMRSWPSACGNGRRAGNCTSRLPHNRTQAKKIISNLVCAQLESKQFQEVNFLALIRCCVVIEQLA